MIMAQMQKSSAKNTTTASRNRQTVTIERVRALAPDGALASNLTRTFALEDVDFDDIAAATRQGLITATSALTIHEKALQIHLQRLVYSFVASALGSAQFYSGKVSTAQDLTAKLRSDHRDHDRDGIAGFASKAQNARHFAAQAGLQAYSLLAAAEGALDAYEHLVGETWKPHDSEAPQTATSAYAVAETEMAAFGKAG
jgi:hypothetical protein